MLDRQRVRTFLLGGLAGVVAGLLFAPRSGRETRGSLSTGADAVRERGRETIFGTRERLEERMAARRYRLPRQGGVSPRAASTGPAGEAGMPSSPGMPGAPGTEPPPEDRPRLRGVPREAPADEPFAAPPPGPETEADTEELRRRISETRSRLRERLERGPADADPGEDEAEGGER